MPLFLIAAPLLLTLTWSGSLPFRSSKREGSTEVQTQLQSTNSILRRLAIPQIVTAFLALTTFHVQIVNRISSGYILWYLHLASYVLKDQAGGVTKNSKLRKAGISAMIIYACIQAALYSAFLPPA